MYMICFVVGKCLYVQWLCQPFIIYAFFFFIMVFCGVTPALNKPIGVGVPPGRLIARGLLMPSGDPPYEFRNASPNPLCARGVA